MTDTQTLNCIRCGEGYPVARWKALKGSDHRKYCPDCADALPPPTRTVANLHKSNSILITNRADLIGINNKGGLVK